nr:cysteine hydrolase family protein [uncultured Dongia sp.]
MTVALLIIDVQHALCSGEYEAFEFKRVIERINVVSKKMREAGALVVLIQHEAPSGPLQYGTEGWSLAAGLDVQSADIYVRKTAPDSFHNTDLQSILKARGVKSLAICGLQSEFCVDTTTRKALALGYPVTLVADAHSTRSNSVLSAAQITAHHNETLANIKSYGPRVAVVPSSEITVHA